MESNKENLYFTFKLGTGKFALQVTQVKEILDFENITKVPRSKPYLRGVMNIRGSVITALDLKQLFGFECDNDLSNKKIVVAEVQLENEPLMPIGLIVDMVDVVTILEPIQSEGISYGVVPKRADFVKAVGKLENDFVIILDLNKIVSSVLQESTKN